MFDVVALGELLIDFTPDGVLFANLVRAVATTRKGAIPALLDMEQITSLLEKRLLMD